jgi:hypothetical protein
LLNKENLYRKEEYIEETLSLAEETIEASI